MSDTQTLFLGMTALWLAGIVLHGETLRRIAKRENKDAYETGYLQGYTDRALGRSRSQFRSTSSEDRNEKQNKAPGEHELPEGQIERQLRNE
jgi:hypothetical protein